MELLVCPNAPAGTKRAAADGLAYICTDTMQCTVVLGKAGVSSIVSQLFSVAELPDNGAHAYTRLCALRALCKLAGHAGTRDMVSHVAAA